MILNKNNVSQCAHLCSMWRDIQMTQTPGFHSIPLTLGMHNPLHCTTQLSALKCGLHLRDQVLEVLGSLQGKF
jgi:hypothetical protein